MSQWGYEYMSDSQVIMEALARIMMVLRYSAGQVEVTQIDCKTIQLPSSYLGPLENELWRRVNEERQHVPLKVRGEDYNPVENLIRPSCPSTTEYYERRST